MLYLHGLGHFHPETVIDNRFLEDLDIGTTATWILQRTGIEERRTVLPLDYIRETRNQDPFAATEAAIHSNADTAKLAGLMALERAGLRASDIGLVISGGSAPRFSSPAEACSVAERLDICAPCLDLQSACTTFLAQLSLIGRMREEELPDFILLVQPENLTLASDFSERNVAVLMGDCTTAAVVSSRIQSPGVVKTCTFMTEPSKWRTVSIPSSGHLSLDGPAVQRFATQKSATTLREMVAFCDTQPWIVGHQANLRMLSCAVQKAGLSESKHLFNVDRYGNTGAAGSASVLSENWELLAAGAEVALAIVGAGLSWGGMVLRFRASNCASEAN